MGTLDRMARIGGRTLSVGPPGRSLPHGGGSGSSGKVLGIDEPVNHESIRVVQAPPLWRAAMGSAAFFCAAPGTVAGLVPFLIRGGENGAGTPPGVRAIGIGLVLAGLLSLLESFASFVFRGRGTPAPIAPPTTLVVSGQYRHVRNPMYLAVVTVIVGQALWFASGPLLAYGAMVWVLFHLRVVRYEEPTLKKSFGAEYAAYRRVVRRWRPRLSPGRLSSSKGQELYQAERMGGA